MIPYDTIDTMEDVLLLEQLHQDVLRQNIRLTHQYNVDHDPEILMEGFADMLHSFGNVFKTMAEKFKEFMNKLFLYVNTYRMDLDKFCTKYKSQLDNVEDLSASVFGFNFTFHDVPDLSPLRDLINEYNSGISRIQSGDRGDKLTKKDILAEQKEFLSTENLDRIRGIILGTRRPEDGDGFEDRVRKYYRNEEVNESYIELKDSDIRSIISNATTLSKLKKEAEDLRDALILLFKNAEAFFSKSSPRVYKSTILVQVDRLDYSSTDNKIKPDSDDAEYITPNHTDVLETWLRFKYNQTKEIAGIANIVARERANAYKDYVRFCKEAVRKALFKKG